MGSSRVSKTTQMTISFGDTVAFPLEGCARLLILHALRLPLGSSKGTPMSSKHASPTVPPLRNRAIRASLTGGNGSPTVEAPDRMSRVEAALERIQQTLDTQFERIAQIQNQLDRAIADRPLPPKR